MKEKLSKIRETLEYSQGTIVAFSEKVESMLEDERNTEPQWGCEAIYTYDIVQSAIALVDSILADLDSPELVKKIAKNVGDTALRRSRITNGKCHNATEFSIMLAQAAINTIKEE